MNGPNIQNHSLMLSEYLHNIQYIDITIPSNSIAIRLFSFNKILLFIKKLAFDGFYPLLVVLKNRFLLLFKKKKICFEIGLSKPPGWLSFSCCDSHLEVCRGFAFLLERILALYHYQNLSVIFNWNME